MHKLAVLLLDTGEFCITVKVWPLLCLPAKDRRLPECWPRRCPVRRHKWEVTPSRPANTAACARDHTRAQLAKSFYPVVYCCPRPSWALR